MNGMVNGRARHLRRIAGTSQPGEMGDEGVHVGIFLDLLVGRLARAVAGAGLDADQVRRAAGSAAWSAAIYLKLWPGTTRSSVSAVVTSIGG